MAEHVDWASTIESVARIERQRKIRRTRNSSGLLRASIHHRTIADREAQIITPANHIFLSRISTIGSTWYIATVGTYVESSDYYHRFHSPTNRCFTEAREPSMLRPIWSKHTSKQDSLCSERSRSMDSWWSTCTWTNRTIGVFGRSTCPTAFSRCFNTFVLMMLWNYTGWTKCSRPRLYLNYQVRRLARLPIAIINDNQFSKERPSYDCSCNNSSSSIFVGGLRRAGLIYLGFEFVAERRSLRLFEGSSVSRGSATDHLCLSFQVSDYLFHFWNAGYGYLHCLYGCIQLDSYQPLDHSSNVA